MQRSSIALLLIFITAPVWAQNAIPGTFRTLPSQTTPDYFTPILTPPVVSFGSSIAGPVIVNRPAFAVTVPQDLSAEPSLAVRSEPTTVAEAAANSRTNSARVREEAERFDFVIAPNGGSLSASDEQSLGEMAAALRKGPPPAQRSFTNDDIQRMNGTSNGNFGMPASSAPKDQPQAQPKKDPAKKDQTENRPHSPFSPPAVSAEQ